MNEKFDPTYGHTLMEELSGTGPRPPQPTEQEKLLAIGYEINEVAATIVQLVQAHKDNWYRLDLLVTNECMRLQKISKKCGVVYFNDEEDE
jgi:hypothetical protein